ncbi:MAG: thioredoxin-like domain-containing protein [Planctomycetota bacterium]|nr:thioredoxin-like domain-containing protein [Planctomycetota bacterium]
MSAMRKPVLCTFLAVCAAFCATPIAQAGKYVGKAFPNFTATDPVTGEKFALKDLRGKVVLIDFWATWCPPCIRELPNVKRTYKKYEDQGFEIVSISLDTDRRKFKSFVSRQRMDWYHVMDGGGWSTRLAKKYNIHSIPAMFLIDTEGVCISDSARGRGLATAIEKALRSSSITEKSPTLSPSTAANRRLVAALTDQIGQAQDSLLGAAKPVQALMQRLDAAERLIIAIDGQLPVPRRPEPVRRRFVQLHKELTNLRQELFVCGFLNDRVIAIPTNPFDDDTIDTRRGLLVAAEQLEPARLAVVHMTVALGEMTSQIDTVAAGLAKLERKAKRGNADPKRLSADVQELAAEATALEQHCREPWKRQLRTADVVLERLAGGGDGYSLRLDDIDGRIAACREKLATAGLNTTSALKLRSDMSALCTDLATLSQELSGRGADHIASIPLPSNPFERGRLRDVRVRIEAGQQLDVASQAVGQMRSELGGANERFDTFCQQLAEMQTELEEVGADAPRLSALHDQFQTWCHDLLETLDGS